ncbi:ATP-binding protein [Odoribacter lunatus]|uniref:ATP-binding protein n=1 Tax=Odoribacter lunatus TaxID=2941335 RepID=UPI002041D797|nr:ATP-binding protein [Odoribacter lunatus]
MENLDKLVLELCKLPQETGWVEFKHNNCDPRMIGENISALANSAVIADRSHAYMIWGVDDKNHELIDTNVRLKQEKRGNQELENWLRYMLSKNADFEIHSIDIDGKHVEIIIISKAVNVPVTFEKVDYIRVGSYTKKIIEFPALQTQLWDKLRNEQFEDTYAISDIQLNDIPHYLNCETYFNILNMPFPTSLEKYAYYLLEEGIIICQDNGLYAITNLGAILFAKKLSDFPRIGRKAIRIVQYEGNNRLTILKEETTTEGYAISFENAIKFVNTLLPTKEDIDSVRRTSTSPFPIPAIRETIANSLIHQDFFLTGTGPLIEIFQNRVEVTNPGTPLVDIMRIVDNPPKSRNEKLASLMRRLSMCEELGRGWDRMVISCELQKLPAPRIQIYEESTKVSLFSHLDFTNIPMEDKIWATYLHACIKFIEGDTLTNSSLRERFGVAVSSSGSISRLIKEVLNNKLIRPIDPNTAPRYMKYIPIWA